MGPVGEKRISKHSHQRLHVVMFMMTFIMNILGQLGHHTFKAIRDIAITDITDI